MTEKIYTLTKAGLWDWVKAICTITVVGVLSYKVYLTPIDLTVDFPTLLSLLLALFSVALAALFYFKATETSNTFYDNTNNFTKNIAQLLAKMESGFGEKLRNLDEGYSSMRDYLQNSPSINSEISETKEKIKDGKEEIEKVIEERNEIVSNLLDRAQLQEEEKSQILSKLKEKEDELSSSQKELNKMGKRLLMDRMRKKEGREFEKGFEDYTYNNIIPQIGEKVLLTSSTTHAMRRINDFLSEQPRAYIRDLEDNGYFEDGITLSGVNFFQKLAEMRV
ncbi:hypothetical protein P4S65_09850 [Pseudoalteromonas sp. B131b]|uniref:hypothetical protein n=1 Tax=unclassified Pseudoalteromonas TaxID=194690 RepID=UPI0002AABD57|nr:hypothetical protein [Pseudoalteromonas sp. Bsw20308]ALQ08795.1 hypothetical protein D172_012520 [Pseudoalteromonas sp. Bsw20308]